jgi:metal-responsive CopG/Arc/MetJ family transcriptional regulator
MRFSLTMEDSLVEQIDKEARQTGTTRAEWIRTACTDALTPSHRDRHRRSTGS